MARAELGVIRWHLDGDAAIRWQVPRNLVGAAAYRYGDGRPCPAVAIDPRRRTVLSAASASGA